MLTAATTDIILMIGAVSLEPDKTDLEGVVESALPDASAAIVQQNPLRAGPEIGADTAVFAGAEYVACRVVVIKRKHELILTHAAGRGKKKARVTGVTLACG